MDIFSFAEKVMSMDDESWGRHSNPWSVWSRLSCLPLLVLALWSRYWIGWWSLLPIAAALFWTWYNPRAFAPPAQTTSWASRGTFGERLFLSRKTTPVPQHHVKVSHLLTAVMMIGMVVLCYGVVTLNFWATMCGLVAAIGGKLWFVDRMVWLFEDMQSE